MRAWAETPGEDTLESLIASGVPSPPPAPEQEARLVVLTSGTTGLPKGAPRRSPKTLVPMGGFFDKIPFRPAETTVIAIPLFHALGFAHALIAVSLGSKVVLRRRFEPVDASTRSSPSGHRAVLVPTMLRRILDLWEGESAPRDASSLRIVFVAGPSSAASCAGAPWGRSGRSSTTCTARPRSRTPRSRRRPSSPAARLRGCSGAGPIVKIFDEHGNGWTEPGRRAASSPATPVSSRATRAARPRSRSRA